MNKRIRDLAEQAGYEKDMFGVGHWDMPECQRFVELIVQECASVAFQFSMENKRFHPDFNPRDMTASHRLVYHSTCQALGFEIKEHFGVEGGNGNDIPDLAKENESLKKKLEIAANALKALNYQENADRLIVESALELLSENNSKNV